MWGKAWRPHASPGQEHSIKRKWCSRLRDTMVTRQNVHPALQDFSFHIKMLRNITQMLKAVVFLCIKLVILFFEFCVFSRSCQNKSHGFFKDLSGYSCGHRDRRKCPCTTCPPHTPTYRAAPLVTHLMFSDIPHAGLASVLGLGAVADARPLPDPSSTGDRAGRPWGPGAPPAVNCSERAGSTSEAMICTVGSRGRAEMWREKLGRWLFTTLRPSC